MSHTIESVMTPCPHTIGADQTLAYAKQLMAELGIRHLPVLEGGRSVGLISDRDIKVAYAVEPERAAITRVIDACSTDMFSVTPESMLSEAAAIVARDGLGSVVVMKAGKVVGIFTTTDACRLLAQRLN